MGFSVFRFSANQLKNKVLDSITVSSAKHFKTAMLKFK